MEIQNSVVYFNEFSISIMRNPRFIRVAEDLSRLGRLPVSFGKWFPASRRIILQSSSRSNSPKTGPSLLGQFDPRHKGYTNISNVETTYPVTQCNNIPKGQNLQADVNSCDKFKTFYSNHKQSEPNRKRAVDSVDSTITHWTLTKLRTVPLSRFHSMKGNNIQEKKDPRGLKIGMVWT